MQHVQAQTISVKNDAILFDFITHACDYFIPKRNIKIAHLKR